MHITTQAPLADIVAGEHNLWTYLLFVTRWVATTLDEILGEMQLALNGEWIKSSIKQIMTPERHQ